MFIFFTLCFDFQQSFKETHRRTSTGKSRKWSLNSPARASGYQPKSSCDKHILRNWYGQCHSGQIKTTENSSCPYTLPVGTYIPLCPLSISNIRITHKFIVSLFTYYLHRYYYTILSNVYRYLSGLKVKILHSDIKRYFWNSISKLLAYFKCNFILFWRYTVNEFDIFLLCSIFNKYTKQAYNFGM